MMEVKKERLDTTQATYIIYFLSNLRYTNTRVIFQIVPDIQSGTLMLQSANNAT